MYRLKGGLCLLSRSLQVYLVVSVQIKLRLSLFVDARTLLSYPKLTDNNASSMPDDGSINIISDFLPLPLSLSLSRESSRCTQCLFLFVFLSSRAIACVSNKRRRREVTRVRHESVAHADQLTERATRPRERERSCFCWQLAIALALALAPSAAQYTLNRSRQHVVVSVAAVACSLSFYAPVECCFETDAKPTTNAKSVNPKPKRKT